MLKRLWIISLALLVTCGGVFASSSNQTDWLLLPSGGTYSWDGNTSHSLVGSNIGVASLFGIGTSSHNGSTLLLSSGVMSFTTGSYNGNGSNWSWGAGGTLTLTGCIAGVTTSGSCNSSTNVTLMTETFQSVSITAGLVDTINMVLGQGTYNSTLAAYFGVPTSFSATSADALFSTSQSGHALSGTSLGGLILGSPSVAVAEDWNLFLTLGLFALALGVFGLACRLGLIRPVVR